MQLQQLTAAQLDQFFAKCRGLEAQYVTLPSAEIVRAPDSTDETLTRAHAGLVDCLRAMPDAAAIELQALAWVGGSDVGPSFSDALDYSKTRFDLSSREYMAGKDALRQNVEKGLHVTGAHPRTT